MKQYILAIDQGSQSTKLLLFDRCGNVVCQAKEPLRPLVLGPGGTAEHPDNDLWDSLVSAANKLMGAFSGDPQEIAAIALCGIRFCRALLKRDGSLFSPVMSWMDARVSRCHEQTSDDIAFVTTASGYLTHQLTGAFTDTAANYQGVWPMDTDTWDWLRDEAAFEAFHLRRDMLFQLKMPGDLLGYVSETAAAETSLPAGIPVIATANDKAVEALGAGCLHEDTTVLSLGTYIAGMVVGTENRKNAAHYWTNFADVPGRYLYESNGIRRGMWTVSWFRDVLGESYAKKAAANGLSAEELLDNEAAAIAPGSDGLMTVPDFLAPTDMPFKKGMMIGFDGRHTRAHIHRSILEAVALTMKNNMDAMLRELGKTPRRMIVTGGGANSSVFMQIISDAFNLPVSRNVISGAAAVGAAVNAAVAAGLYAGYDEAVDGMVRIRDAFLPDEDAAAAYEKLNRIYRTIPTYTDPLLKQAWETLNG